MSCGEIIVTNRKKTIIITGASSGLGRALAINYANANNKLFLFARSKERLQETVEMCTQNGADVNAIIADVTDSNAMKNHLDDIANKHGVDVVIACAGVSAGTLDGPERTLQVNKIFATNINGVINTVMPLVPHMIRKKSGNIAIVSSMAGFLGLSSAPSYSASKGAARLFSDALGGYLREHNVHVSTIIPGYISTPMTEVNNFPMPFKTSADKAAQKIINGIAKNKGVIAFPLIMYYSLRLAGLIPAGIMRYINSKLPGKPAFAHDDK